MQCANKTASVLQLIHKSTLSHCISDIYNLILNVKSTSNPLKFKFSKQKQNLFNNMWLLDE